MLFVTALHAETPPIIQYQGRVAVSGAAHDGTGYFKFALVSAGDLLWDNENGSASPQLPGNTEVAPVEILVGGGQFSVLLGDTALGNMQPVGKDVFLSDATGEVLQDVRLRVWFSQDNVSFQELTPSTRLGSVPFALVAAIASTVADRAITTEKIADGAVSGVQIADGAVSGSEIAEGAISSPMLGVSSVNSDAIAAESVGLDELMDSAKQSLAPPGCIMAYGGDVAPSGWVLCDGQALAREGTYENLFLVLGAKFGAPDLDHFNVPDLRGQFLRGAIPNLFATFNGAPAANAIELPSHPFSRTGMRVRIFNPLAGLSDATDYFIIRIDADHVAFASSHLDATAGFELALSGTASGMVVAQAEDPDAVFRLPMADGATAIGASVGSVQGDEFRSHRHQVFQSGNYGTGTGANAEHHLSGTWNERHQAAAGGSETRPKNVFVNYIIKY